MVHILLMVIVAGSPIDIKHKTANGITSYNIEKLCITTIAVDRAIEISLDELSKQCTQWSRQKMAGVLVKSMLFWRNTAWLAPSGSCEDVPKRRQTISRDGKTISCLVVGLQSDYSVRVVFEGVWTDTLPHELAHLFQQHIDGEIDIHHKGFVAGSCIDKALKASVVRFNAELYDSPMYKCEPTRH